MKIGSGFIFGMADAIIAQALFTAVLFSRLCAGHQGMTGRQCFGFAYSEFCGGSACILINDVRRVDSRLHHIKRYAIHNKNSKDAAQRFQAGEIRSLMVC